MCKPGDKDYVSGTLGKTIAVILFAVGVLTLTMHWGRNPREIIEVHNSTNHSSHRTMRPCVRVWQAWVASGGMVVMGTRMWFIASAIHRKERERDGYS